MPAIYSSLRSPSLRFWPPPTWFWFLVLVAGLFWSGVILACCAGSRYTPREQAFLAAQYQALRQLRAPSLSEMASPYDADVQAIGPGVYEVRSWVAGSDRLGYPRRQAYTARVACPEGARRFEEWQLVEFRFE